MKKRIKILSLVLFIFLISVSGVLAAPSLTNGTFTYNQASQTLSLTSDSTLSGTGVWKITGSSDSSSLSNGSSVITGAITTIDLGNHTLTCKNTQNSGYIYGIYFDSAAGVEFTIKNGTINNGPANTGVVLVGCNGVAPVSGGENASLSLENCNLNASGGSTEGSSAAGALILSQNFDVSLASGSSITATDSASDHYESPVWLFGGGSGTVSFTCSGEVSSKTAPACIQCSGNGTTGSNQVVNIENGSEITCGGGAAIYTGGPAANVTVSGGTVTGLSGITHRGGQLTVTGGTIVGTGTPSDDVGTGTPGPSDS